MPEYLVLKTQANITDWVSAEGERLVGDALIIPADKPEQAAADAAATWSMPGDAVLWTVDTTLLQAYHTSIAVAPVNPAA